MREGTRRRRGLPIPSTASVAALASSWARPVYCWICRGPSGAYRKGCFNRGPLLRPSDGALRADLARAVVGRDQQRGREVYIRP